MIVGLGNPGADYVNTRHNSGFWFVDALAQACSTTLRPETRFHGEHCKVIIENRDIHLLKPMTFMNKSGQSVAALARYYKIEADQILVAHDELDLEPGIIKLKKTGGHGGHNGLRDIISHLGTKDFNRLRIGIGHPGHRSKVVNYVLHAVGKEQQLLIAQALSDASAILPLLLKGEMEKAMHQLHTQDQE